MSVPSRWATCQMVSPLPASTSRPSRVNFTVDGLGSILLITSPRHIRDPRVGKGALRAVPTQSQQRRARFALPTLRHHNRYQLPSGVFSSSGKYFITLTSGFGAACPSPQIEASRIALDSSESSASFHGPDAISLAAFSVPTLHGVHWPQLSSSKNFIRLRATAFISSRSDRITTACDPTKQPYGSKVPKSRGRSPMLAGNIPPDAPPGR